MSFLHSKLHLLNIAAVATTLSLIPVLASANPPIEEPDHISEKMDLDRPPTAPISAEFIGADVNNDGVLDMSEFTLYAGGRAVSGDSDYTAIVSSGDYEAAFKLRDADASGSLSEAEVTGQDDSLDDEGIDDHDMEPEGQVEMERED